MRGGLLLGREVVAAAGATAEGTVGVAQFNCLADYLSDAFPRVEGRVLAWSHRFPLLVREITALLSLGMIVCCEEVEHFEQFEAALSDIARCFFAAKVRDGCAVFVPLQLEVLGEPERVVLMEGASQIALVARVRDAISKRNVLVCCTHFKAKDGFEVLRQGQAKALCLIVAQREQPEDMVLIAGDFNDVPSSLACEEMRKCGYRSAYEAMGVESYSTSKIRKELTERCIDYIWYDPAALSPCSYLTVPSSASLGPTKLPLEGFPSDHLSIAATFSVL